MTPPAIICEVATLTTNPDKRMKKGRGSFVENAPADNAMERVVT